MTPVLEFEMVAEPVEASVAGLIAIGSARSELHGKLLARAVHYDRLSLAMGDDWTAITTTEEDAPLPWLSQPPVFLYALGPAGFCEMGYRPNVPSTLHASLIAKLRRQFGSKGAIVLTVDKIYDLSEARALAEINLVALK